MEMVSDFFSIHISRQGSSHIKAEKETKDIGRKFPCQDRSFSAVFKGTDDVPAFCFATVADGHGSAPHFRSGEGAEFAVQTMLECVKARVKKISELQEKSEIISELEALTNEIYTKWKSLVLEDIQKTPITETEYKYLSQEVGYGKYVEQYKKGVELENVYGCTALSIVSVPEKKLWFAFQIGDGDIVIKKKGSIDYEKPIPSDDLIGGEVFSLCDLNAPKLFKWKFGVNEEISAAFCSSDGIYNSFNSDKGLFYFYNTVIEQFCFSDRGNEENTNINLRVKNLTGELENYLDDLSRNGSHDDMSVSGFLEITTERILGHKNAGKYIDEGKSYLQQADKVKFITLKINFYNKAIKQFQEAAKNGFPEGYMLGGIAVLKKAKLENKNEFTTVQTLFQRAISGGCLEAKKYLGEIQCQEAKNKLKEQKFQEILDLFTKSAENDITEAAFYLSKIYKNPQNYGKCTKENIQKSFNYLKKAATVGFTAAEFEIAKCYAKGNPIPANSETAAEYFEKALKQLRENPSLETEGFSKIIVLETMAKFYAKSSPQKAIVLCNEAIEAGDGNAHSILRNIQSNRPLQKSNFSFLKKQNHETDSNSDDEKRETPQFATKTNFRQIQQQSEQNESQPKKNILMQNHIQPAAIKVQQTSVATAPALQETLNKPNSLQKLSTSEQQEKYLCERINNMIWRLSTLPKSFNKREVESIRDNLSRVLKEICVPELDINKKGLLFIDAQTFLGQAKIILEKGTSVEEKKL